MTTKTPAKPTQHELDVTELKNLKLKLLDLIAERDALAVRVLELENAPHEVVKVEKLPDFRGSVMHPTPTEQTLEKLELHRAFIRKSLKTATFNSTEAAALLEP